MEKNNLRKLSRGELLQIMVEQGKEIERLKAIIADQNSQIASRKIEMEKCGSLAEASLALFNVVEASQNAADTYLMNAKEAADRMTIESEEVLARSKAESERILADAEAKMADAEAKMADAEAKMADAEAKMADAEAKMADAETKLAVNNA